MNKYFHLATVALGAALAPLGYSQAVLNPGDTTLTPIATSSLGPDWSVLANTSTNFTGVNNQGNDAFYGSLLSYVLENNTSHNLAFAWEVINFNYSPDSIVNLSVSHYAGFDTSVIQDPIDISGINSTIASRTNTGDVLTFSFLPGSGAIVPGANELDPGTNSSAQFVITNATQYSIGSAQLSDGGVATVATYEPATPEPAPLAAMGLGLLGLVVRRRNRK